MTKKPLKPQLKYWLFFPSGKLPYLHLLDTIYYFIPSDLQDAGVGVG